MPNPVVSVVVPTRDRAGYLDVTLRSLLDQDLDEPYEVIVVDDGSSDSTQDVIKRHGVRSLAHDPPRGPNAARNEGARIAEAELIALVDDDVFAPREWLRELVEGARRHPDADAFGGPIRARLEGPAPRSCGREEPPVTTLDLGSEDHEVELVWSANMLLRRRALERAGDFDESLPTGGDEEEWLRRLTAAGGSVVYLAAAPIDHRRAGDDARLRSLMRSAYHRGYNLRAYDASRGVAPGIGHELRVLAGCGWHTIRRACPQGLIMGAHSAGRLKRALLGGDRGTVPVSPSDPSSFSSGVHGTVGGKRGSLRRAGDRALDAWLAASGTRKRIGELAGQTPPKDVLVVCIHGPDATLADAALAELRRSRHHVRIAAGSTAELAGGKFQNANALLDGKLPADWVLVVDDDVVLPPGFLDGFIAIAERAGLDLAQPAQTLASHAAWASARRVPFSLLRETNFVEIGPVTAFSRRAADALLPFPDLKMGWGLDLHWAALAAERGWKLGVVDALPVRHEMRPVGGAYAPSDATAEAQQFLATRPYLHASEAGRTLRKHRRLPA